MLPKNIMGAQYLLVAKSPAGLCPTGKTVLQPKVFETIRIIIINGLDHSIFMTQLEDGDLGICRLHFEVRLCDHKFSVLLGSQRFREVLAVGNLEWPAF